MNTFLLDYKNFLNDYNSKINIKQKNFFKKIIYKLQNKPGFVLIKNFNVDSKSLVKTTEEYKRFLSNFGTLLKQNKKAEKIVKVQDKGGKWSPKNRGFNTSEMIPFHTDGGQIAALLCIRPSLNGGKSKLTSSENIYNQLKKNQFILNILLEGFHYHTRGESKSSNSNISKKKYPVFFKKNKRLHCMFNKKPILWALEKSNDKEYENKIKSINKFERLSNIKKNIYRFKLNSGDILIYNNYKVLHGRDKFTNNLKSKRLLLRAWMNVKKFRYNGPNLLDAYQDR
jgi:hypothetical protein